MSTHRELKRWHRGRVFGIVAAVLWLAAAILFGTGIARADAYCTTSHMSGMTFTLCRYSNPWYPSTTTTCYDRSGDCTTTGGSN